VVVRGCSIKTGRTECMSGVKKHSGEVGENARVSLLWECFTHSESISVISALFQHLILKRRSSRTGHLGQPRDLQWTLLNLPDVSHY
jgi:hypothetical protein